MEYTDLNELQELVAMLSGTEAGDGSRDVTSIDVFAAIMDGIQQSFKLETSEESLIGISTSGVEVHWSMYLYDNVLAGFVTGLTKTYVGGFEITPSDDVMLPRPIKAIMVGTAGDLDVTTVLGDRVTIPAPVGLFPLVVLKVWDDNTDADDLVGLY